MNQYRQGVFAEAHKGTLFLDEIGYLKPEGQATLNRVVENDEQGKAGFHRLGTSAEESVSVRLVSAFNSPIMFEEFFEERYFLEKDQLLARDFWEKYQGTGDEEERTRLKEIRNQEKIKLRSESRGPAHEEFLTARRQGDVRPFNEDLAYRLRRFSICIPPLRMRAMDAIAITCFLLDQEKLELDPFQTLAVAEKCCFGNVRSIRNFIEEFSCLRAVGVQEPDSLEPTYAAFRYPRFLETPEPGAVEELVRVVRQNLEPLVRLWRPDGRGAPRIHDLSLGKVLYALAGNDWVIKRAAAELKVSERTLGRRVEELGLQDVRPAIRKRLKKLPAMRRKARKSKETA